MVSAILPLKKYNAVQIKAQKYTEMASEIVKMRFPVMKYEYIEHTVPVIVSTVVLHDRSVA
jgi:hypothetical protein